MTSSLFRLALGFSALILLSSVSLAEQPVQPRVAPPVAEAPVELVPATKEETWTLGGQQWDFKDIATAYVPVKGTINPQTGVVEWTLEIVRELAPGEIGTQENLEGTPFKPTFIDEERIAVQEDARVRITKITGKVGDRIRMTLQLPKAELLEKVKLVRIERRTEVGF